MCQRKRMPVLGVLALLLLTSAGGEASTETMSRSGPETAYPQAFSELAVHGLDPEEVAAQRRALHRFLVAEEVQGGVAAPYSVRVSAEDLRAMDERDPMDRRLIVGIINEVDVALMLAGTPPDESGVASRGPAFGALRFSDDGFVWTGAVRSEGATAVRLYITDFDLPPGAELYIYNREGHAMGPYVGRGQGESEELWTNTLSGDELILQLRYQGEYPAEVLEAASFTLSGIGHLTQKFAAAFAMKLDTTTEQGDGDVAPKSFCTWGIYTNASCVENARCHSGSMPGPVWQNAHRGIAHILYPTWPSLLAICSGGLVADTNSGNQIPYFLTANHCLSHWAEAAGMEAWFFYQAPCKILGIPFHGPCLGPLRLADNLGATVLATSATSDYTLLRFWLLPPFGAVLMGWNAAPVANTDGFQLYRISHPSGAPQAYSEHEVDISAGTCASWPRGSWIYSRDTLGATEGGSSGSPVLNSNGQVVGQLHGGCGSNLDDDCDAVNNATVDGALAAYFCDVKQWLDPLDDPPVAMCADVSADAHEVTCDAHVTTGDIDQGSYDPGGGNISLSMDPAGPVFGIGSTSVTLTATGYCDDVGTCTATVNVVDVSAPTLGSMADVTAECTALAGTPVELFDPSWTEHCSLPVELTNDASSIFPMGTTTVTYTARDDAGNSSDTTVQVTVEDTTGPVFTSEVDPITVECTNPDSTSVDVPLPAAEDACSPPVGITSDAPAQFPPGTTTVNFTAEDALGNGASSSTTVTVLDTTAPVIACNAPETIKPPDAPITFTTTATDACGGATSVVTGYDCFKYSPNGRRVDKTDSCVVTFSGSELTILDSGGVGDNITWTVSATDQAGNQSTLTCELTVVNPGRGHGG